MELNSANKQYIHIVQNLKDIILYQFSSFFPSSKGQDILKSWLLGFVSRKVTLMKRNEMQPMKLWS